MVFCFSVRREGDSNPRNAFDVYTLSRRASSATRASLPAACVSLASVIMHKNNYFLFSEYRICQEKCKNAAKKMFFCFFLNFSEDFQGIFGRNSVYFRFCGFVDF